MVDLVSSGELSSLLSSLESNLLNRREHRELLYCALRRRDLRLAGIIWQRLRHAQARHR
jgi:hypothetical protein